MANTSEETPMEETSQEETVRAAPVKRKNCDTEGNEQPDAKKNKATPDSRKNVIIAFLIHIHIYIMHKLSLASYYEIDTIADITSMLSTFHTIKRQTYSSGGQVKNKVVMSQTPSIYGYTGKVTLEELYKVFEEFITKYSLVYGTAEKKDTQSDTGILSSILALTAVYKGRVSEVRTGNLKFVYRKTPTEIKEMALSLYGLDNGAAAFMAGANLNPSIQSSMKQSLGPLTVALQLCNCKESKYQKSWKAVFCQVFANVPRKEEIAQLLAGTTNQHKEILQLLYQFCMMGATRSSNKAAIPMAFLLHIFTKAGPAIAASCKTSNTMLDLSKMPETVKRIDFSGKGLWHIWNACVDGITWKIRGDPEAMTSDQAFQITAHAILGLHKEDLEVPRTIFHHKFVTRKEMGSCFLKKNSKGLVEFELKKAEVVTKLASAAQTCLFDGSEGQYARCSVVSGKCTQRVNIETKLIKKLQESPGLHVGTSVPGVDSLVRTLAAAKMKGLQEITKTGSLLYGTTTWYKYSSTSPDSYGEPIDLNLNLSGKYFFGRDDE
uniref:Nucleocapsid protein n=1 Tax=Sanxia Water Strider Virus 3 TaxID=1608062 RepID=A0A1L3KKM4_9ORTO|nr:nucleocapsid protein [Sanxia Water Strider Virus 3]